MQLHLGDANKFCTNLALTKYPHSHESVLQSDFIMAFNGYRLALVALLFADYFHDWYVAPCKVVAPWKVLQGAVTQFAATKPAANFFS